MAIFKSVSSAVLLLFIFAMAALTVKAQSPLQDCAVQLPNLNSCAPFVVPGNDSPPSPICCSALSSLNHDCLCNTLRIAAQIPAKCNLPALTCGA